MEDVGLLFTGYGSGLFEEHLSSHVPLQGSLTLSKPLSQKISLELYRLHYPTFSAACLSCKRYFFCGCILIVQCVSKTILTVTV